MWFQVSTTKQLQMVTDIPRTESQTRQIRDRYVTKLCKYCFQVYMDVLWPVYATFIHMYNHELLTWAEVRVRWPLHIKLPGTRLLI